MAQRFWAEDDIAAVKALDWRNTGRSMLQSINDATQKLEEAKQAVVSRVPAAPAFPSLDKLMTGGGSWSDPEDEAQADSTGFQSLDSLTSSWFPKQQPQAPTPSGQPAAMPSNAPRTQGVGSSTITQSPNGPALRPGESVGNVTLGPIKEGDPQGFFESARGYADAVEREYGIPASFTLAVAANETGYGQRRYMAGENNYHGIQDTTGTGTPYRDWRPGPNGEELSYEARQARFADPMEGFRGFGRFLTENPRYQPALERYKQTGDAAQFARDVHGAGYAEDPEWSNKVTSIMRGIPVSTGVGSVTAAPGVGPQSRTGPMPEDTSNGGRQTADLYPRQDLLDDPDKWAVCGPLGIMAFAAMKGQPIDYQTAKEAARKAGWTPERGMAGPDSQVAALNSIGVPTKKGPIDVDLIAREVRNGNPVGLSSPGETGHYFTVQGVDDQGRLDLGNSALALRASGGRRWFTIDELRQLGAIGNVTTAIYIDNPSSPTPSVAADPRQSLNAGGTSPSATPPLEQATSGAAPGAAGAPALHPNLAQAFKAANGRDPSPSEQQELMTALGLA